jgi:hypothetical protein
MRWGPAASLSETVASGLHDAGMASGADIAIAVGTTAAATIAGLGLIVSLLINSKDRKRADQQARDDRKAAVDLAAADRAAIREDAQRRHIVDLLLALGREVGKQQAYSNMPQGGKAVQQIMLLLNALPAECAHTVRQKFNVVLPMKMPGAVGLSRLERGRWQR